MNKTIKQLWNEQRGSTLILFSLAFMGLMAIAGLALDGGTLYVEKAALQKAANAAVLSGAQELTNDEADVKRIVNKILVAHGAQDDLQNIEVEMGREVNVDLKKEVPLTFFTLFGKDEGDVAVHAAAGIGVMGRAQGVAPLGIDDSIPLEYKKTYELKVDETGIDTGNFGVLDLGGQGANSYGDNLRNGYGGEIEIGDILQTKTGNMAGKTRKAVEYLIDACPYPEGDLDQRDCPRVILIPVYEPYQYDQNQLKKVKVTGFAYFYINEPMGKNDKTIKGTFIKRVGTGFVDSEGLDKGAYAIRLTE